MLPPNFPAHHDYCPFGLMDATGHYAGPNLAEAQKLITQSGTRGQHVIVDVNAHVPRTFHESGYFVGVLRELGYQVTVRTIGDSPDGLTPVDVYHKSLVKIQIALCWRLDSRLSRSLQLLRHGVFVLRIFADQETECQRQRVLRPRP
jgi:hypothetical protein